jgi:hypothetical protein
MRTANLVQLHGILIPIPVTIMKVNVNLPLYIEDMQESWR